MWILKVLDDTVRNCGNLMNKSNFQRMIELAENIFATKNDPNQLDVNEEVIEHLLKNGVWGVLKKRNS